MAEALPSAAACSAASPSVDDPLVLAIASPEELAGLDLTGHAGTLTLALQGRHNNPYQLRRAPPGTCYCCSLKGQGVPMAHKMSWLSVAQLSFYAGIGPYSLSRPLPQIEGPL